MSRFQMASSGDGHGVGDVQRYIDPDHVHSLFMNFEFQVLIDYVDSFPGAAGDELCDIIKKIVQAFLERALIQRMELLQVHQLLGAEAQSLAQNCSLAAPQNMINIPLNPDHHMDSLNSSTHNNIMMNKQVHDASVTLHQGSGQYINSTSSHGERPRYINPNHVYELYFDYRPEDLMDYLCSFPGAAGDEHCVKIKKLMKYLNAPDQMRTARSLAHAQWSQVVWKLAKKSRLAAPDNIVDLNDSPSNPDRELPLRRPGLEQFIPQEVTKNAQGITIQPSMMRFSSLLLIGFSLVLADLWLRGP